MSVGVGVAVTHPIPPAPHTMPMFGVIPPHPAPFSIKHPTPGTPQHSPTGVCVGTAVVSGMIAKMSKIGMGVGVAHCPLAMQRAFDTCAGGVPSTHITGHTPPLDCTQSGTRCVHPQHVASSGVDVAPAVLVGVCVRGTNGVTVLVIGIVPVSVGVRVGVMVRVGVFVGVNVEVGVKVFVLVLVGVAVGVCVGVLVAVGPVGVYVAQVVPPEPSIAHEAFCSVLQSPHP